MNTIVQKFGEFVLIPEDTKIGEQWGTFTKECIITVHILEHMECVGL